MPWLSSETTVLSRYCRIPIDARLSLALTYEAPPAPRVVEVPVLGCCVREASRGRGSLFARGAVLLLAVRGGLLCGLFVCAFESLFAWRVILITTCYRALCGTKLFCTRFRIV